MNGLAPTMLEAELASVVLYDVSDQMPRHPTKKGPPRPRGGTIDRVLVHHSGALGRSGIEGAKASARYVVEHRDFPGPAYHFWLPRTPLRDEHGRLVVLRLCPDEERAWHTGAVANDRGVGVCLQGNATSLPLTMNQRQSLAALLPWLAARYGLDMDDRAKWLGWHSIGVRFGARQNKAACPGKHAEEWLREWLHTE